MVSEHPDRELVMSWLDGQRPGADAEMRRHLEICDACRDLAEDLRGLSAQLREWRVEPAPASFDERVTSFARGFRAPEPARRPLWRVPAWPSPIWKWTAGVTALATIAIVAFMATRPHSGGVARQGMVVDSLSSVPSPTPARAGGMGGSPVASGGTANKGVARSTVSAEPLIARTASIHLSVLNLDDSRAALTRLTTAEGGSIARIGVSGERPAIRIIDATLKIPSARLDAALAALRTMGRVVGESQGSEDVTAPSADLDARLANARHTEQRLAAILDKRSGTVADVLAVEREMSRVRGDIEQMEAERKRLTSRIDMATINVRIEEQRRAELAMPRAWIGGDLRNALVDGLRAAAGTVVWAVMLVLHFGPAVILWGAALALPLRWLRQRRRMAIGRIR
jgi:hypothetical protein